MDDKKKKFTIPEAEKVNFIEEDIITLSDGTDGGIGDGENEESFS